MIFLLLEALCLIGLARLAVVYHRESLPRAPFSYEPVQVRPALPLDRRNPDPTQGRLQALRALIASISRSDRPIDSDRLVFAEVGSESAVVEETVKVLVRVEPSILIGRPPVDLVPTPQWTPRYRHPEWVEWTQTDTHDLAEIRFFGDQPDDLAVQRRWDEFGRAKHQARTGATR